MVVFFNPVVCVVQVPRLTGCKGVVRGRLTGCKLVVRGRLTGRKLVVWGRLTRRTRVGSRMLVEIEMNNLRRTKGRTAEEFGYITGTPGRWECGPRVGVGAG